MSSLSQIGSGAFPDALESPVNTRLNNLGHVGGFAGVCYATTDFLTWANQSSPFEFYPFGVANVGSVLPGGGVYFYQNTPDELSVTVDLNTYEYVNDRALGDFYTTQGDVNVFVYDASTNFLYFSDDGGATFNAGAECNIDISGAFSVNLTVNKIVYFNGAFHLNANDGDGNYSSVDLETWIPETIADFVGWPWFVVTDSYIYALIVSSPIDGAFSVEFSRAANSGDAEFSDTQLLYAATSSAGVDAFIAYENDDLIIYLTDGALNFEAFRLTATSAVSQTSGNQAITGGGINGSGGAVGFSKAAARMNIGQSIESLAYPAGIIADGDDFGIDLGL